MSQTNNASQQVYDLLVSRDFEPEALDSVGKTASDPSQAEIISFDYKTPEKNYGTVVIAFDDKNNLDIYFSDNMTKAMEGPDKGDWYDFLYLLRMFAKRNLLTFSLKNLSRLKFNMKTMAAVKESLFEGYFGNRKVSYSDEPDCARLIIKHNRTLGENDARYRYIESLFVENADGERFKIPSRNLTHGRVMVRHVAEGGRPYDPFGTHITNMFEEMKVLSNFVRACRSNNYDGDAAHMVDEAVRHYQSLKAKAKRMLSRRGYFEERDSFDPGQVTDIDEAIETIRELFVKQTLDQRIEEAVPLLARLTRTAAMKEMRDFESWAENMTEGTWSLPNTPEQIRQLKDLMSKELPVGPDAANASQQLYDLVGDDVLFDLLDDIAATDPDANIWDDARVMSRLKELGIDAPAEKTAQSQKTQQTVQEGPTSVLVDRIRRLSTI